MILASLWRRHGYTAVGGLIEKGEVIAVIGGRLISDADLARLAEHSSTAIGAGLKVREAVEAA